MDDTVIAELSVLIALERETTRGVRGPATEYLAFHPNRDSSSRPWSPGSSPPVVRSPSGSGWEAFLEAVPIAAADPGGGLALWRCLPLSACEWSADRLEDLWIAASALAYDLPVVTANARDFRRVPGLEVVALG